MLPYALLFSLDINLSFPTPSSTPTGGWIFHRTSRAHTPATQSTRQCSGQIPRTTHHAVQVTATEGQAHRATNNERTLSRASRAWSAAMSVGPGQLPALTPSSLSVCLLWDQAAHYHISLISRSYLVWSAFSSRSCLAHISSDLPSLGPGCALNSVQHAAGNAHDRVVTEQQAFSRLREPSGAASCKARSPARTVTYSDWQCSPTANTPPYLIHSHHATHRTTSQTPPSTTHQLLSSRRRLSHLRPTSHHR